MINPLHKDTIKKITETHLPDRSYTVVLFGSRVRGKHRRFSDIDVGIIGPKPVPAKTYVDIVEALDKSDLPYRIDVVDFSCVSEKVKKQALMYAIPI